MIAGPAWFCTFVFEMLSPRNRQANSLELLDSSDDEARVAESQFGSFAGPLYLRDWCMKGRKESVWSRPEDFNLAIATWIAVSARSSVWLVVARRREAAPQSQSPPTTLLGEREQSWEGGGLLKPNLENGKAF